MPAKDCAPLPLSSALRKDQQIRFAPTLELSKWHPELAAMVMEVISIWSQVDADLVSLVTERFLKSDFTVVASIFDQLNGNAAQRAVEAAAQSVLNEADFKLVKQVMSAVGPTRKTRNSFAHGLWCHSPDFSDALVWLDPRDFQQNLAGHRLNLSVLKAWKADPTSPPAPPALPHGGWRLEKILLYSRETLECTIDSTRKASALVRLLRIALSDGLGADEARQQLTLRLL